MSSSAPSSTSTAGAHTAPVVRPFDQTVRVLRLLLAALLIVMPAEADSLAVAERGPAVQLTPTSPAPSAPETPPTHDRCEEMSWYRRRAGLPAVFDRIGWRESNCRNEDGVRTSCCYGWWQLNVRLHLRDHRLAPLYADCGVDSADDVNSDTPADKLRQACAAAALYSVVGMSAWAT